AIASLAARHALANVLPPMTIDVTAAGWPVPEAAFDLVFCANMLHIAPWRCTADLMRGSARHLAPHGVLVTYGPYLEHGVTTSEGNLAFDRSLRQRDPAWGIRQREDVEQVAAQAGLRLAGRHAMPSNNLLLEWRRG
ncbi:MAG: SAM-dependent methyltransferase, partial [Rhodoferax sp.]|nr:SAM-dependent methyltransferase [Rhodoferax sp.]